MATEWTQTAGMDSETETDNVTPPASPASDTSWAQKSGMTSATDVDNLESYAEQADASATAAAASATAAAASAAEAAASVGSISTEVADAEAAAAAAATSATSASTSATTATTKAAEASTSATSAATSATAAQTAQTAAETAQTGAETAETNAASSATAAASSASSAQSSADAALAALDSFDDRYLGPKASDPTLDNDGNALVAGALYFNTTDDVMKVYEGSTWVAAYASLSGALIATNNLSDLNNAATARTNLGLGTAATTASTDYAAASHTHTLSQITDAGTAAAAATTDFATAAQGANADTAFVWGNHALAGYLTSYTETDPVYVASSWYSTTNNSANWDTAYGWGNHASAGYLTDITGESIQNLSDVATMSPTTDQVLSWNGSAWTAADMAGGIAYVRKTANYTASHNEGIIADTSGGAWTLTLPATPSAGDTVIVVDGADWAATNLTVGRNGSTIEGDAEDMTMDIGGSSVQFTYDGTTWQVYAQVGVSGNVLVSGDNVSELVNDAGYLTSAPSPFAPTTVSGASQALDLSSYNFFDAGTLTADTTLSFTSLPTEASWTYTAKVQPVTTYDIGNAFYAGGFKSILPQDTNAWGMFFKPDGTKMYVAGTTADKIYQYSLATAWDVSTAIYDNVSFGVASQEPNPRGLFFKPDGTKMYLVGTTSDTVYQYSLSTAWDVSTASYDSVSFSVASQDTAPSFVFFKPDGTKMYVGGNTSNAVYQYSLSTAWSISTASYDSVSFSITTEATSLVYTVFNADGTKMYALALSDFSIHQYSLSTAWDVSTASYDSISLKLGDTSIRSIFFKDDGTRLYSLGVLSDEIVQYETYTLPSITLPASVQNSQRVFDPNSRIAYTFFTTDGGTNVYIINQDGSV